MDRGHCCKVIATMDKCLGVSPENNLFAHVHCVGGHKNNE